MVGVAGPLSGPRVAHAPLLLRATRHLRAHGLACQMEDDGAAPDQAVAVARRFIARGVDAVVGHFNSACAEAVLPLYRQHGITLLLPASSQTGLAAGGGAYRLCSTDLAQASLMAARIGQLGLSHAAVDIAIDDSPYAQRVLGSGALAEMAGMAGVVGLRSPPARSVGLRLVLATCANALAANRALVDSDWNGAVIYADDAHVEEFFERAGTRTGLCQQVVGSHLDYGTLVEQACALIARWRDQAAGCTLSQWLSASGLFSHQGDALDAHWMLCELK